MARIIAVANQKGGVGKTTTSVNLAAEAAAAGIATLLVEVDPQGNAADATGHPHRQLQPPTVYEALWGRMQVGEGWQEVALADAIRRTDHGFDVLPANNSLAAIEWEFAEALADLQGEAELPAWAIPLRSPRTLLKDRLVPILDRYTLIIIDCPPSLGLLTVQALVAATEVLPIVQTEFLASSVDTAADFCETVDLVKHSLNPDLKFAGVVLNMFDGRRNHDLRAVDRIKEFWSHRGVEIFGTVIGRSVVFADASERGRPVLKETTRGAQQVAVDDMRALAREVLGLAEVR